MKASLARLYNAGSLTDAHLAEAVTRGWITQAEADEIKSGWTPA